MRKQALTLFVFLLAAPAPAQDTLKPGDTLSGKLRVVKTRHPNRTPITAYQIVVDHPKNFAKEDNFCDPKNPPVTFHLVVLDDKAKLVLLKRKLGKSVKVVAEDLMCSETAWHVGDAVVFQWHFTNAP
jgi:hypothetical protein